MVGVGGVARKHVKKGIEERDTYLRGNGNGCLLMACSGTFLAFLMVFVLSF